MVGRARTAGLLDIVVHNLRDFTTDKHHVVDDVPFGGGPGMVMKPEPFFAALAAIRERRGCGGAADAGQRFRRTARGWRRSATWCFCGRYEGIDERVREALATEEISIGDYVLSGGEVPALAVIDGRAGWCRAWSATISRWRRIRSRGLLDYPHYTRPAEFEDEGARRAVVGHHGDSAMAARRRCSGRRTAAGPAGGRSTPMNESG